MNGIGQVEMEEQGHFGETEHNLKSCYVTWYYIPEQHLKKGDQDRSCN